MQVVTDNNQTVRKDAGRLADFIMFTQRSFLLNLRRSKSALVCLIVFLG